MLGWYDTQARKKMSDTSTNKYVDEKSRVPDAQPNEINRAVKDKA